MSEAALAACGIFNLRDLGGLPTVDGRRVRAGRLLRGDALHRADATVIEHLLELGAALVVDLRTVGEVAESGRFPEHDRVAWLHYALLDEVWSWSEESGERGPEFLTARYLDSVERHGDRFVELVGVVLGAGGGVVLHCAAGKDRTGMTTAFLLSLVGVSDEEIVADYARSAAAVPAQIDWLRRHHPEAVAGMAGVGAGGGSADGSADAGLWAADPAVMRALLDWFAAQGGAEGFAREHGLTDSELVGLRSLLVG